MAERTAISMASRSRWPDWRQAGKTRRSSRSTSRATSFWIVSAVFFLGVEGFLVDWTQTANRGIHLDGLIREPLEIPKLRDFALGLARGGVVG
jgi:hypothetical protein